MRGKLVLLVGVGIGYVLGTRAGRQRYEDIKTWANKLWNDPRVQRQVHEAEAFAKDKAPDVARIVGDGAKKVMSRGKARSTDTGTATNPSDMTGASGGAATSEPAGPQAHD